MGGQLAAHTTQTVYFPLFSGSSARILSDQMQGAKGKAGRAVLLTAKPANLEVYQRPSELKWLNKLWFICNRGEKTWSVKSQIANIFDFGSQRAPLCYSYSAHRSKKAAINNVQMAAFQ